MIKDKFNIPNKTKENLKMIRNNVRLIGRLTADPELRYTKTEKPVCNVVLAINDFHGGEADYFHLVFWNGKATALCEYKSKGDMIAVEGYLKTRSYTDKDNVIRNIVEVIVEETDFLGKTKTQEQEPMPDLNPNHKSQEEWKLINDAMANVEDAPF